MGHDTAFLYGLIQGLSEFLPVSSSGHLALLPFLMEFRDPGVLFDLCMHMGTALAVCVYFRAQLLEMILALPQLWGKGGITPAGHFLRNFAFATAVSVVFILVLKPLSGWGRSPWVIMGNQAFFGILLWLADRAQRKHGAASGSADFFHSSPRWRVAAAIGATQALAIFPGVSRSGITLTTGFFMGLERVQAGHFSFLLSLPIILAGMLVELPHLGEALRGGGVPLTVLLLGIGVSFGVGLATIHLFLGLIARISLGWFTLYRLALAGALLAFLVKG